MSTLDPGRLLAYLERLTQRPEPEYDWQPTTAPPVVPFRELKIIAPPVWHPPTDDLARARAHLKEVLEDYLMNPFPTHRLLVKALPGTGKTTASVAALDALYTHRRTKRTLYAGPRHDFFQDLQALTLYPQAWYEWHPRRLSESEDKPETCRYTPQISAYIQKGWPAIDFCKGVCGYQYMEDVCPWHRQKAQKEPIIYGQHQHLAVGHPLEFEVLLGDESPLQVFKREWRIPMRWIMPPGMDPTDPLAELLHTLAFLAERAGKKPLFGEQLLDFLGGPATVVETLRPHVQKFEKLSLELLTGGGITHQDDVEKIAYAHLPETVPLLYREASRALAGEKYPHRIILGGDQMTLLLRYTLNKDKLPPYLIWLDATARPELYERVFGVPFQVIDANPKLLGKIYQVTNRTNGKSAMVDRKSQQRTAKADETLALIQQIVAKKAYTNAAMISYKNVVLEVDWISTGHFYASRGTNAFQDADAIFVVGAPQPSAMSLVNLAKCLFFERDEAFRVVWSEKDVAYQYIDPEDGQGRAYPVSGFWSDADLQMLLQAMREDELIQAVHRIRPVNHPCDIWLFTNIPVDGLPPDELVSLHDLYEAPEEVRLKQWKKVQELIDSQEMITSADLQALGIHRNTANKYIDLIVQMPGWEAVKAATKGRGRPAVTLMKIL